MKLSVFPSSMETARSLIFHLVDIMNAEPDKTFNIAVSGGSTPALMFDLWANEYADITPWGRMKLYWVDERCVAPDHPASNYGAANQELLAHVPAAEIYPMDGEIDPGESAVAYEELLRQHVPAEEGMPRLERLNALVGKYVNLEYRLPNGMNVRFLDDEKTYLGNQLECEFGGDRYFGVLADMDFILISTYEAEGTNPELVIYKKR